ncbi:hypothetical protein G6O69_26655 [Pseudenhygromyxa sp. WMMC2535]|uniref:hypothetical protein n=1 Tax=Pseudenhygromyxa sp. WMMC2535 TaxID=2712867 RepID=UPI00155384F5|nr:hypothetical protein [Pseudenhygromyxa sp. WMMC2535]NVB41448.1 hypothetical protein [Pseudenhygromyxa sp. WMMC2535]
MVTSRPALPLMTLLALLAPSGCEEVPRTYSTSSEGAKVLFTDDFDRGVLGPDWNTTGAGVTIERGALHLAGLHNHPVWLRRELPADVRVEFDAWAETDEGDIKIELAGDGHSFAKTASYTATGYVVIFGGWSNSLDVIARRDEHGADRVAVDSAKVEADRRYHFSVTRRGGELRWEIDGRLVAEFDDDDPLLGDGHEHFAFNNWEAPTRFDNLVIYALE